MHPKGQQHPADHKAHGKPRAHSNRDHHGPSLSRIAQRAASVMTTAPKQPTATSSAQRLVKAL